MAQVPQISQQVKDSLAARGYDSTAAYEINRLPSFSVPRTTACIFVFTQTMSPLPSLQDCHWQGSSTPNERDCFTKDSQLLLDSHSDWIICIEDKSIKHHSALKDHRTYLFI